MNVFRETLRTANYHAHARTSAMRSGENMYACRFSSFRGQSYPNTTKLFKFEEMVDVADKRLFRAIKSSDHCLNHLLPGKRNVYASKLRNRGHQFLLPVMHTEMHKKSFINRCLYKFV